MKIVAIGDTHELHRKLKLPHGDVLIVVGDFSSNTLESVADFGVWLKEQPHKYKIILPGNHDICFEINDTREEAIRLLGDVIYLNMSGVTIEGVKFYGMPYMPNFLEWSFMFPRRSSALSIMVNKIPDDTNILITHAPPYRILDRTFGGESVGCEILTRKVENMTELKAHFFGHIHEAYGSKGIYHNVSVVNEEYELVNKPKVIEI